MEKNNSMIDNAVDVFITGIREKHNVYPFELDKDWLSREVVSFVHGIEVSLIDRYGLDTDD